eukprot:m.142342 g.142342  ORF g.142342 m.142342 type:complete len:1233 (-) comp14877_c0_seq4:243-3941(-)
MEISIMNGVDPAAPSLGVVGRSSKGLVVINGKADIHGKLYQPTWTRLATTAFAGDEEIILQDAVDWEVGMKVVIATTTYDDRPPPTAIPQNEVRTITAVRQNGLELVLDAALSYRHHAGTEYQAEVGLLSRRIVLEGHLTTDDEANGFGGHVIVTGSGGEGRFTGVQSIHMGQRNIRGRYPFHYHLIDISGEAMALENAVAEANSDRGVLSGDWFTHDFSGTEYEQLYGGSDGVYYKSCNSWDQDCTPNNPGSASFVLRAHASGLHQLLISKPPDALATHNLASWVGVTLMKNVTVTVRQDGNFVASFSYDMSTSDPIDVLKKWNSIGNVDIPSAGDYEVSLVHAAGTNLAREAMAVDALWLRPDPRGKHFMTDCSVQNSFYRCVSLHGTNNIEVTRNVAFNIWGHCYYLEDGVEERNTITYNLAVHPKPIGRAAAGSAQVIRVKSLFSCCETFLLQIGDEFREDSSAIQPADHAAAGFYITNARNWIYGNAASGGWTGFSFPNLPDPVGAFQSFNFHWFNPMNRKELKFSGNSAHSSGRDWVNGMCMYVGGRLTHREDGTLHYHSGRNTRTTYNEYLQNDRNEFDNLLVFLCRRGVSHWGNDIDLIGFEAIDVEQGAELFGSAYLHKGLIQAQTTNPNHGLYNHLGFQFYDTWTKTMLDDIVFRNFEFVDDDLEESPYRRSYTNRVFEPMDHSDTFKPQGISAVRNITYENVDDKAKFDFPGPDTGAAYMYNFVSFDGTAADRTTPSIVGSHIDWWDLGCDCEKHPIWKTWVCNQTDEQNVASVNIDFPGITLESYENGHIESHRHIGYVCQYSIQEGLQGQVPGDDKEIHRCMILTKNPTTTGVANRIWHYRFFGGGVAGDYPPHGTMGWDASPQRFRISYSQIPRGNFIVMAVPYPLGTTFNVSLFPPYQGGHDIPVPLAESLAEILQPEVFHGSFNCPPSDPDNNIHATLCDVSNVGPKYYWDSDEGMLYIRVLNPRLYVSTILYQDEPFTRDGMWVNAIQNWVYYDVQASCAPMQYFSSSAGGLCNNSRYKIPAATRPSGDSCDVAHPTQMLPARLDWSRSVASSWQRQGPNFSMGFKLPVGGVLSLSADDNRYGNWMNLVQLPNICSFNDCNMDNAVLINDFRNSGPSFDLVLNAPGRYFFAANRSDWSGDYCAQGVKFIVEVSADPSDVSARGAPQRECCEARRGKRLISCNAAMLNANALTLLTTSSCSSVPGPNPHRANNLCS